MGDLIGNWELVIRCLDKSRRGRYGDVEDWSLSAGYSGLSTESLGCEGLNSACGNFLRHLAHLDDTKNDLI